MLVLFREQFLFAIGDFLIVADDLQPADVIHVIAGDDYRTNYAIQLYKQGYGKLIFFTGGRCKRHGYNHGEHGEQLALAAGVPLEAIAYDETSVMSTYDEVILLMAFIEKNQFPVHSVIAVSDPFHMRRARWTYWKVLRNEAKVLMAPVKFEETPYQRRWWEQQKSKLYVKEEYEKFFYYIARYQLSWGPLKEWLASLDRE